jgi:hypothetical protein
MSSNGGAITITYDTLMFQFQQKLKIFKQHLKDWNKNVFENIFQVKRDLEQRMKDI